MKRITISVDDDLADAFEAWVASAGYENRSEAFRDLVRQRITTNQLIAGRASHCVAALSYVYNHHTLQLSQRLMGLQHEHHHLALSTMHAHLDHDDCIETLILTGPTKDVETFARQLIAERGVRHGQVNLIPLTLDHAHGHAHPHPHEHLRPVT